jgi:hypothetical protein
MVGTWFYERQNEIFMNRPIKKESALIKIAAVCYFLAECCRYLWSAAA